jgi:hypothetical protein
MSQKSHLGLDLLNNVGKEDDSDDDSVSSSVTVNDAFHIVTPSSTTNPNLICSKQLGPR